MQEEIRMNEFYVTIIHRPEMVPEYIQREAGTGKQEDLSRSGVIQESLDIFRTQQHIAHEHGLRTTIQMTYASLFNAEAVALAKEHHDQYGDEIGSTFLGLQCQQFREKFKSKELAIWLFSLEDKRRIVDEVLGKFYEVFGFYPISTGSYYMDAELVNYIKSKCPMIKLQSQRAGRKARRPIGMPTTPGTPSSTAARGIPGSPRNATSTAPLPMKTMTLASWRSRIFHAI
jgi:hypothetical protein